MSAPDVRAAVEAALRTVQGTHHHLGLVTFQVLTDRVTEAVTPLVADEQAYDGELAMLRGLVRTLRAVVRDDRADVAQREVRRLLYEHAADERDAYRREMNRPADAAPDTLAAWLAHRFDLNSPPWNGMPDDDRSYWEHQARAVRRAVARGGFKNDTTQGDRT